jgi:hypothetical protein
MLKSLWILVLIAFSFAKHDTPSSGDAQESKALSFDLFSPADVRDLLGNKRNWFQKTFDDLSFGQAGLFVY